MKSFIFSLTCLFVLFACTQQPKPEIKEVSTTAQMNEKVIEGELSEASFSISGMMCKMGCAKAIETNLSKMEGVQQASVDFETFLQLCFTIHLFCKLMIGSNGYRYWRFLRGFSDGIVIKRKASMLCKKGL